MKAQQGIKRLRIADLELQRAAAEYGEARGVLGAALIAEYRIRVTDSPWEKQIGDMLVRCVFMCGVWEVFVTPTRAQQSKARKFA